MGTLHDRPICYECHDPIETGVVFAPPCCQDGSHDGCRCASVCWHGLCLMKWREKRESVAHGVDFEGVPLPPPVVAVLKRLGFL